MQNVPTKSVFSEITDFLATSPSPQAIIDYQLPDYLQSYAHDLLEKNSKDELEQQEYEDMMDFVRVDQMMSLLKIKMRIKLKKADG